MRKFEIIDSDLDIQLLPGAGCTSLKPLKSPYATRLAVGDDHFDSDEILSYLSTTLGLAKDSFSLHEHDKSVIQVDGVRSASIMGYTRRKARVTGLIAFKEVAKTDLSFLFES